ncbi:hypothetical protein PanWU01x14_276370 [Parasponia andersonii]|uniref:Uncharacterized protein n=1 Tax=Parasponia andersonii TaxID=3476 RepID=A0A2P5B2Y5_PARAD|nr:hypothetical protein PanWU01x14_276370 [Parasponia andersonii]
MSSQEISEVVVQLFLSQPAKVLPSQELALEDQIANNYQTVELWIE